MEVVAAVVVRELMSALVSHHVVSRAGCPRAGGDGTMATCVLCEAWAHLLKKNLEHFFKVIIMIMKIHNRL